jgi:dTDP-4-amino-4,6-dideoxygalactose transaminase
MADMQKINDIAARYSLVVIEDGAQAHGAWRYNAANEPQRVGTWGHCTCFSFYPTKNLGAMGDGGAIVTNDPDVADRLRWLRQYGWSSKYVMAEKGGRNSRLDELQAAILRVKLRHLETWNTLRRERATWYHTLLADTPVQLPPDEPGHVYHLYVVTTDQRDALRHHLTTAGIGSDIHYPLPAHLQPAYASGPGTVRPYGMGVLPHTEKQARRVLSLPLYPELTRAEVEQVAAAVAAWSKKTVDKPTHRLTDVVQP